jgi:N-acetylglucosaminyl-diphospho-decaprenol L-rhamnosyltransferase
LNLGVVVVTHRQPALALQALSHVAGEVGREDRVVVVNDPASCDAKELQQLNEAAGTVILNDRHLGYGANLNRGVRALADAITTVLLINDDAFVSPTALQLMSACLKSEVRCALVGGRTSDASGRQAPSGFRFPSVGSEIAAVTLLPDPFRTIVANAVMFDEPLDGARHVDWVLGAAMLVRRCAFEEIGGFDERFFLYSEETDFAKRLRLAGWRCAMEPRASVIHLGESSTQSAEYRRILREARGLYIRRHFEVHQRIALVPLLAVAMAWNAIYLAGRSLARRGRPSENAALWRTYAASRPIGILRASR